MAFKIVLSAVLIVLGVTVASAFAHGDLIWAGAFSDRGLWRYMLASQPIFGLGLGFGVLVVETLHRRPMRALGGAALVIWSSNALSFGVIGFLTVVTGGM
jgi:hypothetical protein